MSLPMRSLSLALTAALSSLTASSHGSLAACSASLMMPSTTFLLAAWANITAPSIWSSRELIGFGFDHHHRIVGAGDDQVEIAVGDLLLVGLRIYSPSIMPTRAAPIGPMKGTPEMVRAADARDHRDDVGLVLAVVAEHLADNENFIVEAFGEERPNRAIDQAAGQRFLFGGAALALEEAARDTPGGREFFLIVDGQREEILPRLDGLGGGDRAEDDGFAQGSRGPRHWLGGRRARFRASASCRRAALQQFSHQTSFFPSPGSRTPPGASSRAKRARGRSGHLK